MTLSARSLYLRAAVWVAAVLSLYGQGNTGSLLGTVTDSTGAVVPKAAVRIINEGTGVRWSAAADSVGNYLVQFLPPGAYRIEVEAPGFKRFVRENLTLDMNRQLRVDAVLETGATNESVTVTAQAPLVETETGTLSTTVETQMVDSLPLLSRDPQALKLLSPGVVQNKSGDVLTDGGQVRRDSYFIDGAHTTNHVWSGNAVNPNPDVINEFKVLTNSFSAEYGETSGAIMTSTTKSGTNRFHGDLFEFFQNDKLNAGNYFAHAKPVLRQNQFGGTIGGPIRKDKTFFFFDIQETRERGTAAFTNLSLPIDAFRHGDFSSVLGPQVGTDALGRPVFKNQIFDPKTTRTVDNAIVRDAFPGNMIPADRISPAAIKLQALFPQPRLPGTYFNYNVFGANGFNQREYDIKIDHNFSDKDKLMGRYSDRHADNLYPQILPGVGGGGSTGFTSQSPNHDIVLNEIHVFGPRATNDLHLSWWKVYPHRLNAGYGQVGMQDFGIFGLPYTAKLGTPEINFQGTGGFTSIGSPGGALFIENQMSTAVLNQTSIVTGRHNIKFGGEVRKLRIDNFQPNPNSIRFNFNNLFTDQRGFANTGYDYAGFLLGLPAVVQYNFYPSFFQPRTSIYALFVQDDFRVNRKLTLNIGLRWDAPLYWHERRNRSGIFDLKQGQIVQLGVNGFRDTPYNQDWSNWGPRFGFAYAPLARQTTVIRGGFGIFSISQQGVGQFAGLPAAPVFLDADGGRFNTIDQVNWKATLDFVPYQPLDKSGKNLAGVTIYPDNNPISQFYSWNLNVEHQIANTLFQVGYAGSRGVHLPFGGYNLNVIPPNLIGQAQGRFTAPFVPYPQWPGGVSVNAWIGSSYYHALQVKVERRFSAGLSFLSSYTFGKNMETGDAGYRYPLNNRSLDRGVDGNSAPQRFTTAFLYQLPAGHGRRWTLKGPLDWIAGGWEVSGILTFQSGFPLIFGSTFDPCQCGVPARPNVVSNPRLDGSQQTLNQWFNPAAFQLAPRFSIGNAGRGLAYGPGQKNLDGDLSKRFDMERLREGMNLELRAEFFNLTNTPYFGDPNTTIGSATAGRISGVVNNARQMQMALKLFF